MITSLTPEQEKDIQTIKEEYLTHYFSLSFDEKKVSKLLKIAYGNKKVPVFIMDSPYGVQVLVSYFKNKIGKNIRENIGENIGENIWENILENIRVNIGENIRVNIRENIWKNIRVNIERNIRKDIRENILDNIGENIGENIKYEAFSYYLDSSDYFWIAYYDYFIRNNLIHLDTTILKRFENYKEAVKCNSFLNVFMENMAFISKPPVFLNRNEKGRLHCTTDYAIYFKDGYGQHYVNGVYFPPELFKKAFIDKTLTAEELMKVENMEVKSVLIEQYGADIYKNLHHKVIDEGEEINLYNPAEKCMYMLIEVDYNAYKQRYVLCQDYSTDKKYMLPAPSPQQNNEASYNLDTYRGAIAWTCKDKDYWKKLKMRT